MTTAIRKSASGKAATSKATATKVAATKVAATKVAATKVATRKGANRKPRYHHSVYVVELHHDVWYETRFRDANPNYDGTSPCIYVGMTGLDPEKRFANHKAGIKGNRYVLRYGLKLRPDLYEFFNPMPYAAAATLEAELAEDFRKLRWAVWQA